ncbi:hypothetical protein GCM10010149_23750 [Nonomuraea roseoviolacea subsp. roseoviolacea]|uniref:hypothetical protein n=1 Tax=Nonomuraea roseoviolacea TaxID=103837 RepID=UPI0031DB9C20
MSEVRAGVSIYQPRASEMTLRPHPESETLFFTLSTDHVWFALNAADSDVAAEAEAMDRLAELATEAAARLRALHTVMAGATAEGGGGRS